MCYPWTRSARYEIVRDHYSRVSWWLIRCNPGRQQFLVPSATGSLATCSRYRCCDPRSHSCGRFGCEAYTLTGLDWERFARLRPSAPIQQDHDRVRASPPFQPDILEVADAGGVRVVAVAEYGDIDHV